MKRQAIGLEKTFAKDTSHKRLLAKIYEELWKFNNSKTSNPIKNWAQNLNRQHTKEGIQKANKYLKRFKYFKYKKFRIQQHMLSESCKLEQIQQLYDVSFNYSYSLRFSSVETLIDKYIYIAISEVQKYTTYIQ